MEFQRESIFLSALRSFSKVFFGAIGLLLAVLVTMVVMQVFSSPLQDSEKTTLTLLPDHKGNRQLLSMHTPAILRIDVSGIIGDPKGINTDSIETILLDSRDGLLHEGRIKGILLYMNTPGGAVTDSDNIYRMLLRYKRDYNVPVFAYVDGLCASGGMYIACAADRIFAGPVGIIGSVGVIAGPFFNFVGLMDKLGLQAKTMTEGLDKDFLNPTRIWKEGEDTSLRSVIAYEYKQFVDVVTQARPKISRDQLVNVYGAHIFDGTQALQNGYIDEANSSEVATLLALVQAANLNPDEPYQYVELTPTKGWLSSAFGSSSALFSGKVEHSIQIPGDEYSCLKGPTAYLYKP